MFEDVSKGVRLRIWWRHWSVVLILAVLAALVIWAMLNLNPWLKTFEEWRVARYVQKQADALKKGDHYGGITKEETLNLFISALEKGDTELASKYFVIEKQEAWMKALTNYKNQSLLASFIKELKSNAHAQNMFQLYPNGVWKISDLE